MQHSVLAAFMLVIAAVMIAGCAQSTAPAATSVPTTVMAETAPAAAATTTMPQVSFALGDHYLQKSYSFQSEKDLYSEQFRVDNPSWGIDIAVLPLNDDLQYCWFEMNVTNIDTGHSDSYGYGRSFSYEKHQQFPMYVTGPYKIDMRGNRVKVDVTAAKRNP